VPVQENISYSHPLDVLGRFMPAPLKKTFSLHGEIVSLETNDSEFFSLLQNANSETSLPQPATFQWKLLRDVNILDGIARTSVLKTANLMIVSMGPALFAGLDPERKELLAFIGGSVSVREYQSAIAPLFVQLTKFALGKGSATEISVQCDYTDGCVFHA
jgi:hypothetical protein